MSPKSKPQVKKVVLAYSGGLDTSVIVPWLKENYGCEVVCFCADVGQGDEDMAGLEQKAIKSGASQFVLHDMKEEFASEYLFPMLKMGAVYEHKYLLGTSVARPLIAKHLVDVAQKKTWKYRWIEILLFALHFVWYFALIFPALGFWKGLFFILIQQALFGLYMASVFAPNHKGMLIVGKDEVMDFLRLQVLTARNVRAHPITDFWYGGLNYQVEHHLFPSMARNQLREAQAIIRKFCEDLEISYHETSMAHSYVEILDYLHIVSAPLRQKKLAVEAA